VSVRTSTFKVGDTVTVVSPFSAFYGYVGTITQDDRWGAGTVQVVFEKCPAGAIINRPYRFRVQEVEAMS
jgi:hypothetical protein